MKKKARDKISVAKLRALLVEENPDDYLDLVDGEENFDSEDLSPTVLAEVVTPQGQSTIIEQLDRAGYSHVVPTLRELQAAGGTEALTSTMNQLNALNKRIEEIIADPETELDLGAIKNLGKCIEQVATLRAKLLILPFGSIHPRNMLPKNVNVDNRQVNVNLPGTKTVGRRK